MPFTDSGSGGCILILSEVSRYPLLTMREGGLAETLRRGEPFRFATGTVRELDLYSVATGAFTATDTYSIATGALTELDLYSVPPSLLLGVQIGKCDDPPSFGMAAGSETEAECCDATAEEDCSRTSITLIAELGTSPGGAGVRGSGAVGVEDTEVPATFAAAIEACGNINGLALPVET
jgi:hypothetical protein